MARLSSFLSLFTPPTPTPILSILNQVTSVVTAPLQPIIQTLETTHATVSSTLTGVGTIVNDIIDNPSPAGIASALNDTLSLAGSTLQGVANTVVPLPLLENLLDAAGATVKNVGDSIGGSTEGTINLEQLLSNPFNEAGEALEDVAKILDRLVSDAAPITNHLSNLPVVGDAVAGLEQFTQHITGGISFAGGQIKQITIPNLFEHLDPWC